MTSTDKELEEQLLEAGNKLADPPSSVEELLSLLEVIISFPFKYYFKLIFFMIFELYFHYYYYLMHVLCMHVVSVRCVCCYSRRTQYKA